MYQPPVQQGNVLPPTHIGRLLHTGMTKQQVANKLGQPVLANYFSQNRWTYVHTFFSQGGILRSELLTLYFQDDRLVKVRHKRQVHHVHKVADFRRSLGSSFNGL